MRALVLLALFLLVGCGGAGERAGAGAAGRQSAAATPTPTAPPLIVPTIAYVVAPDLITSDVPMFVRRPGTTETPIDPGMRITAATPDFLVVISRDGHVRALRVGDAVAPVNERTSRTGIANAVSSGGVLYEYDSTELFAIDGDVARSVPLPSAAATTVGPCELRKGIYDLRASSLSAVAPALGHLYAYVATMGNGAIVDLDDGRRVDLNDAGGAIAMTAGADGMLYALTYDGRCSTNDLVVRRIDPVTMREDIAIDLGHRPPAVSASLVATASGAVYVHEIGDADASLLRVDAAGVTRIALPPDSGLLQAAAPDGTIYLFGGRARNVVSRFDPRTTTIVTVDAAQAPAGSFIGALFFPEPSRSSQGGGATSAG